MMETRLDMFDAVITDLRQRSAFGRANYGSTGLYHDTYSNWLKEAYEEALDLVIYLRGGIEAQKQRPTSWAERCALPMGFYQHSEEEQSSWIATGRWR